MPHTKKSDIPIHNYLLQPKVRSGLRQKLLQARGLMATPISQVEEIIKKLMPGIQLDETTLRTLEEKELLTPQRPSPSSQRRYRIQEIARALIVATLMEEKHRLNDIMAFLRQEPEFIEALINELAPSSLSEHAPDMLDRINKAEEAFFWRIFVERTLYLAICLMFERPVSGDIGILVPLDLKKALTVSEDIRSIEDLEKLGESLNGRCISPNPISTFITDKPVFDSPKNYELLHPNWSLDGAPVAVVVISDKSNKQNKQFLTRASEEARRAAGRLLRLLQDTATRWKEYLFWNGEFMAYVPELDNPPLPGRYALNTMSELIIQLGEVVAKSRWSFCCVLLQVQRQHPLVVQGQSQGSPYSVGETELYLDKGSLSVRAFHSGHITYLPNVAETERDFAGREQEPNTRSATAIPIDARPIVGAIYVASEEVNAFSKKDDLIVLRIMENLIAESIRVYLNRRQMLGKISEIISRPQIVEKTFSDFLSDYDFTKEIEDLLVQLPLMDTSAQCGTINEKKISGLFQNLAFISVEISVPDHHHIKPLLKTLGQRIDRWMRTRPERKKATLYCIYGERFYILLKDMSLDQASDYARKLYRRLRKTILSDDQIADHLKNIASSKVHLHIGIVGHSYQMLQDMLARESAVAALRVTLTERLDNALMQGKEVGQDSIVLWSPQREDFIHISASPVWNIASSRPTRETIQQIVGEFVPQIVEEISDRLEYTDWLRPENKEDLL
jgi:DNA-binding transcriptional MerR regulator/GGDEF domain-containing protein